MNDVDFPVRARARRASTPRRAGRAPVKVNMVVKRGVNEDGIVDLARHFRGTGHVAALHRVHGRRAPPTAGGSTTSCPRTRSSRRIDAELPARAGRAELPRRGRRRAGATATAAARSASSPRSPSRSAATARARASRPTASSTPACSPARTRPARARCAAAPATTSSRARSRRSGAPRRPLLRAPHRATADLPKVEMSYIGG